MSESRPKITNEIDLNGDMFDAIVLSAVKNLISEDALEPVLYRGTALNRACVYKDQAELARIVGASAAHIEKISIPAGKARDAFLKKWVKAAGKNKNGLMPLLLLPLAACGGGETVVESYESTIASAIALTTSDLTKYSSSFSITVSDGPSASAADLTAVAGKTSGKVTSVNVTEVTGPAEDVKVTLENAQLVSLDAANVSITQPHNLADLKAINKVTTGTITFDASGGNSGYASIDLSGISADLAAALDSLLTYSGDIMITDAHTLDELKVINKGTSGEITLSDGTVDLNGTAEDILAALDGVSGYSGNITIADAATVADIEAIAQLTTGTATFTAGVKDAFANLYTAGSGLHADLTKVLADDTDVKIEVTDTTGSLDAVELSALIASNSIGSVTLSGAVTISGSEAQLKKAMIADGIVASSAKASVIDGAQTEVAASAISALADKVASVEVANAIDLTGSISDVKALQGLSKVLLPSNYTVELSDTGVVTVTDLSDIAGKTSGAVLVPNVTTVSGSAIEFNALGGVLDSVSFSTGDFKITGDGGLALATLKLLNEKTFGAIDLNTSTLGTDWSGTSDDLFAALNGFSTLGGNVSVSNASSVEALKVIQFATSGSVSLENNAFALTGNSTDIKLALSGIQNFKGAIAISDQGLTGFTGVNLLNEINALTSGVVTASVSGTASQLKSLATGAADSISIQLNSVVTLSDYNQIAAKTGLSFSYSGATETAVTEDVVKILALDDFWFTGSNQSDISSIVDRQRAKRNA